MRHAEPAARPPRSAVSSPSGPAPAPPAAARRVEPGPAADPDEALERARRLGHRPEHALAGSAADPPPDGSVQRKFGFEVELALALGWSANPEADQDKAEYSAPDTHVTKFPVAATGDGFEVHVDHNSAVKDVVAGSSSIVELVTKPPIDESATAQKDVEDRMQQMLDFVAGAKSKTSDLSGRGKLAEVDKVQAEEVKGGHLFVGGEEQGGQQLATGYVQSTYVVKTEKLPQLFGKLKAPSENFVPLYRAAAKRAEEAGGAVDSLIKSALLFDTGWEEEEESGVWKSEWGEEAADKEEAMAKTRAGLAPLMGLVSLMVNTLAIGKFIQKHPTNALLKNHLGSLFAKSRLSSVRATFTGVSKHVLDDELSREFIADWILDAGFRKGAKAEQVVKVIDAGPKVGEWVEAVLSGTGDPLFDAAKNAYSEEIAPYAVGKTGEQTTGVAVESRKTPPVGGYSYEDAEPGLLEAKEPVEDQSQRPIGDWKALAVKLWKFLRAINDIE